MKTLDTANAATAFLLRQPRPIDRDTAVDQCAAHLMREHDMPAHRAAIAALQAYAELEAMNSTAWVDQDASTSNLVVVRHADGSTHAMTLNDIIAVHNGGRLRTRAVASTTTQ